MQQLDKTKNNELGHVPANRTGAILFDLQIDPTERTNLAPSNPENVAQLMQLLQPYIDSAVTPLNELPAERKEDPKVNILKTKIC